MLPSMPEIKVRIALKYTAFPLNYFKNRTQMNGKEVGVEKESLQIDLV